MKSFVLFALAGGIGLAGCQKEADPATPSTGTVAVRLAHGVSSPGTPFTPLVLDAVTYRNANGDAFTVSTFKYYLSNLVLRRADGSTYAVPDSYYLVDQANPASQALTLGRVPVGTTRRSAWWSGWTAPAPKPGASPACSTPKTACSGT